MVGEAFCGGVPPLYPWCSGGGRGRICRLGRGRCSPELRRALPRAGGRDGGATSCLGASVAFTSVLGRAFADRKSVV